MKTILLIDDDDDFREAFTAILNGAGFSVVALKDSQNLWHQIYETKFDLAIIDYFIPPENGLTIVKKFSEVSSVKDTPVIIVSSHDNIRGRIKAAGLKYFFPKPIDFDSLILKIREIIH